MEQQHIDPTAYYQIHPNYTLVPGKHGAFLTNSRENSIFYPNTEIDTNFLQTISPLYASIFAYWDGSLNYEDTLMKINRETDIPVDTLKKFIQPCLENSERMLLKWGGEKQSFEFNAWIPKRFLVKNSSRQVRKDLPTPKDFLLDKKDWDLTQARTPYPFSLNIMLTNQCQTDCLYCYANKKQRDYRPLKVEKWEEIIDEAEQMGVFDIELNGGEVFLYPNIEQLLERVHRYGYRPYLSTKIPLSEERIEKLKAAGMRELQVSIDAWDSPVLEKLLHVGPDYFPRLQKSLHLLEQKGITVKVKSVITRYNDDLELITRLLDGLSGYHNIVEISLAPGEYSLYKGAEAFADYRSSLEQWKRINELTNNYIQKHTSPCQIGCQAPSNQEEYSGALSKKADLFAQRSRCSANISGLHLLPDGKVGICEELYWNPRFLIGDLRCQSLQEIWNSEKALNLYHLSQQAFRKESVCSFCPEFTDCHQINGVCWKYILEAYGTDNWDYPDPRCPYAPPALNKFYLQ